jgi:hypothetical protein
MKGPIALDSDEWSDSDCGGADSVGDELGEFGWLTGRRAGEMNNRSGSDFPRSLQAALF